MRTRTAALSAALAMLAALAATPTIASAQYVTLTADRPCYGANQIISLTGYGFTPDQDVALSVEGQQIGIGLADYDGLFTATMRAPAIPLPVLPLRFTATDMTYRLNRASTTVRLASLGVAVTPRTGDPSRVRRIRARGFFGGDVLYAHISRRNHRRDVRLGALSGACRSLDVKRRLFPPGVDTGAYRLRFDTNLHSVPRTGRSVTYSVTISSSGHRGVGSGASVGERWELLTP